ncbi:MAG: hypothetical protein ABEJ61_02825 [Haloferacaceae archaeon]
MTPAVAPVAVLALQGALLLLALEGARRENVAAAVNGLASLGAALAPRALEATLWGAGSGVDVGPTLPLWIGVAGVLHSLGMLGLYESTAWWDHLTHAVSAALVAALVYAGVVVLTRGTPLDAHAVRGAATLAFVVGVGVFWELVELAARHVGERYGVEPVLVHYGPRDTVLDLAFNVVGALAVVALDLRTFVPLAGQSPAATRQLLVTTGAAVVALSVLLTLWISPGDALRPSP